ISTPIPVSTTTISKKISLTFDNLSDIAEHFLTQNDITLILESSSPFLVQNTAKLTIDITDKKT
ncbi:MAG: hypothetical protein WCH65_02470, partial [bacterium]